jgi:DNA mismatch repair protein MutS2
MNISRSAESVLEFERVREALASLTESALGRDQALKLTPSDDASVVERALTETEEGRRLQLDDTALPLSGLPDIHPSLEALGVEGRALGVQSFVDLAHFSSIATICKKLLESTEADLPLLKERGRELPSLESLGETIVKVIDVDIAEVRDDASQELRRIRSQTRRLRSRVDRLLETALSSRDNAKILQEAIVTTRNGRPVIPIKAECRSQFPGIVHGSSASGATLFVEPLAAVELGNELSALRDREDEELGRILRELTARVRDRRADLGDATGMLAEIDVLQAKARLAELCGASAPTLTLEPELRIVEARHPLLIPTIAERSGLRRPEMEPVPSSFRLSHGVKALVFTGPNTGGKTVALKTAGLLALMVQSGLHIPAKPESRFTVFRSLFADIGDDQSIGSSLSTFSSHLAKVIAMDEELELPALVIMDEVGTGTDPAEGGALGTALVAHFLSRGALVLASTHHGMLKAYALTTEGVQAASFEFDPKTYAPTFRISEGAAGRSLAFEMAERLGLNPDIVAHARQLQGERERQVGELVERLEADTAEAEEERKRLERERRRASEARARIEAEEDEARRERKRQVASFQRSLEEEIDSTRQTLRELLSQAKRTISEVEASRNEHRSQLAELEKRVTEQIERATAPLRERLEAESPPKPSPTRAETLSPGSRVVVSSFGMEGEIVRLMGEEAEVVVRDKKLRLPLSGLVALGDERGTARHQAAGSEAELRPESKPVPSELNLIGCTVEQAIEKADKFLDDAALSEHREVRLIHGHGTGKLRRALREWLSGHPLVSKLGAENRDGVTVVELGD